MVQGHTNAQADRLQTTYDDVKEKLKPTHKAAYTVGRPNRKVCVT